MLKLMAQAEDNIKKGEVSPYEEIITRIENKLRSGNSKQ